MNESEWDDLPGDDFRKDLNGILWRYVEEADKDVLAGVLREFADELESEDCWYDDPNAYVIHTLSRMGRDVESADDYAPAEIAEPE